MSQPTIRICLIGQKFMGRAHSNAYLKVDKFFDLATKPVMHTICARNGAELEAFRERWGWQHASTDWKSAVTNPEIDLVDVTTPNNQHLDMTLAALEAGKHVACEKPLAATLADARLMRDAAKKAKKSKTFVWYSYRRVPAVTLAHQLVKEGRLGRIYHVRAFYLQDWAGPEVPLIWRFNKKIAGSGSHGDLGAHIIDMARFITDDEIVEVTGAISETFIKERTLPSQGSAGGLSEGATAGAVSKKGKVDIDDAVLFLAKFKAGAVGSFEATRFATGYQNKNGIEIHGEKGAISLDFEDLSWLRFFDRTEDRRLQGWHRINVSKAPEHPYASNWWPAAHPIGYEHTFINQAADMLNVLGGKAPVAPLPDFADAYKTQEVLEAASISAAERRPVKISELK
jgi:predicted dehydrogenase